MSEEIKAMRRDIDQLIYAVKSLSDDDSMSGLSGRVSAIESSVSNLDAKLTALIGDRFLAMEKTISNIDDRIRYEFERKLSNVEKTSLESSKILDAKIKKASIDIDLDFLKKHITKEFITKLYRG